MIKRVMLASAALVLGACAASAAPSYTLSKDGSIVSMPFAEVTNVQRADTMSKGGADYDNLAKKYQKGLYWCCEGGTVSGPSSSFGELWTAAIAFTPAATKSVTKITLGLALISGTNGATVSLYSDNGGQPGTQLASGTVSGLSETNTCCSTETATIPSTSLTGGTQYWVVVGASGNTFASWYASTVDQVDGNTYAFQPSGGSWVVINNSNVTWNADVH